MFLQTVNTPLNLFLFVYLFIDIILSQYSQKQFPNSDEPFRVRSRMEGQKVPPPLLRKICHIYLTMMKLATVIPYLKKIQKIYESHDTSLSSADVSIFLLEISKVCYIKKYRYRLHFDTEFLTILTFLESSEVALINMVKILMMSAKMATPGLLKMKVF